LQATVSVFERQIEHVSLLAFAVAEAETAIGNR
jgi:hypothetical protein